MDDIDDFVHIMVKAFQYDETEIQTGTNFVSQNDPRFLLLVASFLREQDLLALDNQGVRVYVRRLEALNSDAAGRGSISSK